MTALLALGLLAVAFLLLGLAATAFGADSREGFGDSFGRDALRSRYR